MTICTPSGKHDHQADDLCLGSYVDRLGSDIFINPWVKIIRPHGPGLGRRCSGAKHCRKPIRLHFTPLEAPFCEAISGGLRPDYLAADSAYGFADNLASLVNEKKIAPHIPVFDKSNRTDGTFSRSAFT